MPTPEQRAANTEWARKKRQALRDAANADSLRCRAVLGNRLVCHTALQSRFVNGQTVPFCPTCDRKARGICIDCGQPVVGQPGKALRCALHKKLASQAALQRYKDKNKSTLRKKEQRRYADPEKHADRLRYKKLWRQSRPGKVAELKRRYAERYPEKVSAYHKQYRATKAEERRARERARYHGTLPPRTCLTCPTVLTGRAKRCDACRNTARSVAREAIAKRMQQSSSAMASTANP